MIVRAYEPHDREAAIGLMDQLNRHEDAIAGDRATSWEAAEACLDREIEMEREGDGVLLVVEAGGEVVGLGSLRIDQPTPYLRADVARVCWVSNLVVDARWRGQGVGRLLIAAGEDWARRQGAGRMSIGAIIGNDGALAAYEALGFTRAVIELKKDLAVTPARRGGRR
jgi:GNAT superfamily N-acetyltransferase